MYGGLPLAQVEVCTGPVFIGSTSIMVQARNTGWEPIVDAPPVFQYFGQNVFPG